MSTYLRLDGTVGAFVSTPDSPALDLLGDIDVRFAVALDDFTPPSVANAFVSKFGGPGNRSWRSHMNPANLAVGYTDAGGSEAVHATTQAQIGGLVDGQVAYLRFTIDLDDGAGNHVYTMWKSTDQGQSWTSVEVETTAGVLAPFNSTAAIEIGAQSGNNRMVGKVYWAEIRNGIGGTVVASPDFRGLSPGFAGPYTDPQGNVWTFNGTAVVAGTSDVTLAFPPFRERVHFTYQET